MPITLRARLGGAAIAIGAAALSIATPARADDPLEGRDAKLACIDAHVGVQRLRKGGKLLAARREAIACAQDACPAVLRAECARWVPELEEAAPTVLPELVGGDAASKIVGVAVDGEDVPEARAGKAIALDPGEHALSVRLADGTVVERSIVVYEGEKRRRVAIDVAPPAPPPTPVAAPAPAPPPVAPPRWPAWPVLALAGGSASALGVFAGFAIAGRVKQAALEAGCAPTCGADDVAVMRRDYLVADVALGTAIAAAGGAIAWQLWGGRGDARAGAASVAARPGGAVVVGSF